MNRHTLLAFTLAWVAASALAPFGAYAQSQYPSRPIRVVVPFPPGGVVDTIARLWAQQVGPLLGTIVVDNRGGAGGVIGAGEVARARPDGYTLLVGNSSTQIINPAVMRSPPYDPVKDFVTIDILAISATSIMVHPSLPVRDLKQLIAYAKANPGKLSYGSAGAGTLTHLAGEMFKQRAGGLQIVHVPYRGTGLAVADLVSGYIPMMTPNVTGRLLGLYKAGKIRILSVNAPARLKAAPEIPATIEILPNMIAQLFSGLFAPAGTPKPIVDRVSQVTRKALADESFQQKLIRSGFEPVLDSSAEKAQRFVDQEREQLMPLIKATGFKK
ncbi:MAG: tripartite tricarboxylate transporter substrate-binding protein [Betaproteobacteria bacterium]|nr:tripartite tricarboxylate transporter substrate-binding protein [Betaproteobacteria bacterium]MDH3435379.1 tripartite tricarboxylate transporter substrate-binding protein [Betaproteobacteria bacterium]